jgi:hypothetical protein
VSATPQSLLAHAQAAIKNGVQHVTNKGALISFANAQADITAALELINTPAPTPTPVPMVVQPVGIAGDWELVFDDECSTFDTTKWTANEGGSQNGITSHASNITATENPSRQRNRTSAHGHQPDLA